MILNGIGIAIRSRLGSDWDYEWDCNLIGILIVILIGILIAIAFAILLRLQFGLGLRLKL